MPKATTEAANRAPHFVRAGERTNPAGKAISNAILLAIPDTEFDALRPHLEFVPLPQRLGLQEANRKLEDVYFLNRGMVSLVFTTQKGESVEVGVVGNEGFTPIPVAAGLRRSPHRCGDPNRRRRLQDKRRAIRRGVAFESNAAQQAKPVRGDSWAASGADGGMQPAARH